jgi:dolichyl-phosphate-mannose--protein O-mannosyl transferase
MFKYIAELINLYSFGFFFLTKNYRFLYSPLEYFSTPLLSHSLSIFTTSSNSGFRHRKFATYYTLYLIVFIIIGSEMSL